MPKKAQPINPKSSKRLIGLCKAENITQKELCSYSGLSENLVSRIVRGKSPLTETSADLIHAAFPRYSKSYLLGIDDYPSVEQERLVTAAVSATMGKKRIRAVERFVREIGFLISPNDTFFKYKDNEQFMSELTDFKLMVRDIPGTHNIEYFGELKGTCSEEAVRVLYKSVLSYTDFLIANICREEAVPNGKPD